ncbi:MAG TPA: STAS domain-containing protein [Armatimonadota bacterium]|jgi:anti-anti-sigma factor
MTHSTLPDGSPIIQPKGEIDLSNSSSFEQEVEAALSSSPAACVVDLTRVTFLDSSVIRILMTAQRSLSAHQGLLVLVVKGGVAERVVRLTRFDLIPDVLVLGRLEEAQTAIAALRAAPPDDASLAQRRD